MKQQTHTNKAIRKQLGYTLLELSIVLVIMALVIMAVISMQVEQAKDDKARLVAETYIRINNAVGSYLANYYDELRKLDPDCGHADWRAGGTGGYLIDKERCRLHLVNGKLRAKAATEDGAVVKVENGLRPTPDELVSLGLLSGFSSGLPLPTVTWVDGGKLASSGSNQNWGTGNGEGQLPIRFMVLIQFICTDPAYSPGPFYSRSSCSSSYDLRSLTFNTQPYRLEPRPLDTQLDQIQSTSSLGPNFLWRVLRRIGSDGFLSGVKDSMPGETGELRGIGTNATITNPTRTNAGEPAPYILAIRNGYSSSGWDNFVRRDGSTPMKADWNTDLTVAGNTNFKNSPSSGASSRATFGIDTYFQKNVKAESTSTVTFDGETYLGNVKKFRLSNEATLGQACDPSQETFSRQKLDTTSGSPYMNGARILFCDQSKNKWADMNAGSVEWTVVSVKNNCGDASGNTDSGLAVSEWSRPVVVGTTGNDSGFTVYAFAGGNGNWILSACNSHGAKFQFISFRGRVDPNSGAYGAPRNLVDPWYTPY